MKQKKKLGAADEVASLLADAIGILGRMALRKRQRLWKYQVRQLEDELFHVLEKLSDVCTSENSSDDEGVSDDGTR